jgi:hypothetical protein
MKALKLVLVVVAVLVVIGMFVPRKEQQQEEPAVKGTAAVEEGVPETSPATEVADVLKSANAFPKTNRVTSIPLTETDKAQGATAAANIASARPEGVTVKVYNSDTERNQARLRMIEECPGCNSLTECGSILIYTPDPTADRNLGIMSQEAKDSLREIVQMQREHHRSYYEILRKHYRCD